MKQSNQSSDLATDAVECFLCLADPDAEPAARARWTAWLSQNDENRAAYHRVRDTWGRPVPGDVWPTHDEIINDGYDPSGPVPRRPRMGGLQGGRGKGRAGSPSWSARTALVSIACILLVAVIFVSWERRQRDAPVQPEAVAYHTARGEQQRIALADGSAITLGPLSELTLTAGLHGRTGRLSGGEALFVINHDSAQPFRLSANGGQIEDVGTTFAVAVQTDHATVTVVEGEVRVSPRAANTSVALTRNEQVSFTQELGAVEAVDGHAETDWSRGRLAYVDRPLAEVVADLGLYTTRDIVLADGKVAAIHYTGTIETDAIDQWATALTRVFPIGTTRDGNRLVLRTVSEN